MIFFGEEYKHEVVKNSKIAVVTQPKEFEVIEKKIKKVIASGKLDRLDELYKKRNEMFGTPFNENLFCETHEGYCWCITP